MGQTGALREGDYPEKKVETHWFPWVKNYKDLTVLPGKHGFYREIISFYGPTLQVSELLYCKDAIICPAVAKGKP